MSQQTVPTAGPSRPRTDTWQPLPYIHSGFAIHPYTPSPTSPITPRIPQRASSLTPDTNGASSHRRIGSSSGKGRINPYEVPLEIGDEFFAFEEYRITKDGGKEEDVWYRGYIVQAVSLPSIASSSSTAIYPVPYPAPEPSVLIGIFPAACVHIRPDASVDDGSLAIAYHAALKNYQADQVGPGQTDELGRDGMEAVKEEDEEEEHRKVGSPKSNGPAQDDIDIVVDIPSTSTGTDHKRRSLTNGRSKRPKSLILDHKSAISMSVREEQKDQPPLPRLTAGDSTIAGQSAPLIDEIACAIREWYTRLPTHLANREYRLFSTVTQHIDALILGRRQLLSQTLSVDELVKVRRECVSRLVKCNVAQGLDVIVRSLEDGSVMVVEKDRAYSQASWIGGITCYVYQIQFAYIDLIPLDTIMGKASTLVHSPSIPRQMTSRETSRSLTAYSTLGQGNAPDNLQRSSYHLSLDIHAFIANPCRPGETAELFFSLYNQAENRFITEEFCLILNHLGSPARDSEQRLDRLRTLFIDLKPEELGSSVYLVCKLVRNGALKMRNDHLSGTLDSSNRQNGASSRRLAPYSEMGTLLSTPSINESATDDSFSVGSGFGGHRTTTVETAATTSPSIVDGRPTFRRPLGCAAIPLPQLTRLLAEGSGVEVTMPIYVPKDEAAFATLHEDIISNRMKELTSSPRVESIALSLKGFTGTTQQVVKEHPSLLHDIPLTHRLGFVDVVAPGEFRNDIYVKLWSAQFFSAPMSTGGSIRVRKNAIPANHGNVQVTLEVRRQDGTTLADAIFSGGSGEPAKAYYHSLVFSHNDKPTFGENIKISLPVRADDCHVFLTFRSRGKDRSISHESHELEKPFAFGYLPLIRDSVCIKNSTHVLVLYRMEKNLQPAPHMYFDVPAVDSGEVTSSSPTRNVTPLRDRLTIKTDLCSTVHTQDDILRSLFRWQGNLTGRDEMASLLRLLAFVDEEEISRFVPRVFDSLFGIMGSNLGERQDGLDEMVFTALTKVLSVSTDRRFPGFNSVLEVYIARQFNFPSSGFHLLRSMKSVMSRPETQDYRAFIKVWHLFFRFIIRSRELDRARGIGLDATSKHIEADFQRQTKAILTEINTLMESTDKALIGTQTLAVQHYADILPDLSQVFAPLDIAQMVITFADNLTFSKGSIVVHKLLLLLQVVKNVFETPEARALLVPAIVRWVRPHLGRYDPGYPGKGEDVNMRDAKRVKWMECNRLAVTVVAWMINKLQECYSSDLIFGNQELRLQEEDNLEYCLTLLPSLLESYAELSSPHTHEALARHRSVSPTIYGATPDVFPVALPFALISEPPPPSLLEQANAEDGLSTSKTFICGKVEIIVVIFTMILSTPRQNVHSWLTELHDIEGAPATSRILRSVFTFCKSVIRNESYPAQWLTLNLMSLGAIIRLLDPIAEVLRTSFIPRVEESNIFDVDLWRELFELLCDFCGNEELVLEDMRQQRRRAQWIIAGDMRDDGATLLLVLWKALGWEESKDGSGIRYGGTRFSGLAGKILELCMSSHDALCEAAVEILFSMIYAEYTLNGGFGDIQSEILVKLDRLFSSSLSSTSTSDPTSKTYFVGQLRHVLEHSPPVDELFQQKVRLFMDEIETFIDLLMALRDLPESVTWRDERAMALNRLMEFTRRINRTDLYIRFVHQLRSLSLQGQDHLAAGYALKLHAEVYTWQMDDHILDQFDGMGLPPQSPFERKEALLYHAMDHFVEAQAYELALEIAQELTLQHLSKTFDVRKIGELLVHQANLWEKIASASRPRPEYFRVAYFGDVNALNRGRDFVVRGQPWERYSEFCEALQMKHPTAMIHRSKIPPPESIRMGNEPVIWVTSLSPEPDLARPVLRDGVGENIQAYWRYNDINQFSSVRPYARDQREFEPVMTWMEKTALTTANPLPGVLSRSEVVDIRYEQISPIENAILEVKKAIKSLRSLSTGNEIDGKMLGNAINGAVDSPVNGGVKLYQITFLDPTYASAHPEDTAKIAELRQAISEYVQTIAEALQVHRVVSRDLTFHETLRSHFHRAFSNEIEGLPKVYDPAILDAPLPPLPSQNDLLNISNSTNHLLVPNNNNANRTSTFSMGSAAYVLPALRLGPSVVPSLVGSIGSPSPSISIHRDTNGVNGNSLSMNGGHATSAVSSPRQSVSGRASRISTGTMNTITSSTTGPPGIVINGIAGTAVGRAIRSEKTDGANGAVEGNGGGRPSFGTRALSVVGSIRSNHGRSRESLNLANERRGSTRDHVPGSQLPGQDGGVRSQGSVDGKREFGEGHAIEGGRGKDMGGKKGLKRLSSLIKR